jgi:U2 small nuclear ribonucleoprotein B''
VRSFNILAILSALKNTFGQYGKVVDIIANRTIRMRGQAFVIFQNLDHALNAKKELQGFPLFSKPMVQCSC